MGIDSKEIQAIHWIYPIVGLPLAPPPKSPPGRYTLESENARILKDLRYSLFPYLLCLKSRESR